MSFFFWRRVRHGWVATPFECPYDEIADRVSIFSAMTPYATLSPEAQLLLEEAYRRTSGYFAAHDLAMALACGEAE